MMSTFSYLIRLSQTMSILALSAVIVTGLIADPVGATVYYVATTGSNSNPGSQGSPWLTMQKAADTMVAGDTTIVKNGTYTEDVLQFNTTDGTIGSRITLRAENQHLAILSSTSSCSPSIDIVKNYITIDGLRLTVSPSDVQCTTGTTANYQIHIRPANVGGSQTTLKKGGWIKNVLINEPAGHRYGGIKITQDDSIIENIVSYGEIETLMTNNVIIRNNTVFIDSKNGIHTKGGSRNTQIYNNIVHMTGGQWVYGIVAGGCTGDPWFYDLAAKIEAYNVAIYNNVVINDNGSTTNTLFAFSSASNSKIFNNIGINGRPVQYIRSCATSGLVHPPNANPMFVNNILIDETGDSSYGQGAVTDFTGTSTINYNNFFGFSAPPSQTNAITGNPLFVNIASDWHLQAGSPGIGRGTVVTLTAYPSGTLTVQQTKDGVTRPANAAWDLGIYQTNGVAGDTTPPVAPNNLRVQ
jgi:hypothetical protein